jgi:hypothetical protein
MLLVICALADPIETLVGGGSSSSCVDQQQQTDSMHVITD